jgi:hypothetical protein
MQQYGIFLTGMCGMYPGKFHMVRHWDYPRAHSHTSEACISELRVTQAREQIKMLVNAYCQQLDQMFFSNRNVKENNRLPLQLIQVKAHCGCKRHNSRYNSMST